MNYDELKNKTLGEVLGETKDIVADAIQELSFDDLERYRDNMRLLREAYEKQQELEKTMNLEPLWAAIAEILSLPEYENISFTSLMLESVDDAGQIIPGSVFDRVTTQAREILTARTDATPQITARSPELFPVTLDKFNTVVVFDFLRTIDPDGQITMLPIKEEGNGSPQKLTSYYSMAFSEDLPPEIKKRLTPFDRLVYGAAASLQKTNGDIMSISQIHRAMGNKKAPSKTQAGKIHNSIIKLNAALVSIKCQEVRDHYGNDGYIDYYGSLFPMEIQRAYINGRIVEGAIHILREELPLISFAKGRDYQIKEVPIELLNSKLSQTDPNIAMQFFVLEQIIKIKEGSKKTRNKILYSTIYEKMGVKLTGKNADKNKQRARKYFYTYLDELKEKGFIKGYQEEKTKSTGELGVKFFY